MQTPAADISGNRILSRLSRDDLDLLTPSLSPIDLPLRKSLEAPNKAIDYVYFPERGFASVVANGSDGALIEVGLIGHEGMTGLAVIMGANRSPNATYMQLAGRGWRIGAANLRSMMEESVSLQKILLQYAHVFMMQTSQTALANGRSKVDDRLARWLLMAHDRVVGNDLALTHEFLGIMLGVRRSGVTVALGALENKGLIRAARGTITILNRKALEKIAGAAYGVPEAEFKRLFA
jgi:CRP-like cAMP-binding protein